jgi:uncharacterized protein
VITLKKFMEIEKHIKNGFLKIIVKTNSPKTEIIEYDETRQALKVNVHAQPIDGKANIEIIKYFSKLLKKKVEIKSGKTGKEKFLRID